MKDYGEESDEEGKREREIDRDIIYIVLGGRGQDIPLSAS